MIEIIAIILFIYLIFANRSISARLRAVEIKLRNNVVGMEKIPERQERREQVNNMEVPISNVNAGVQSAGFSPLANTMRS